MNLFLLLFLFVVLLSSLVLSLLSLVDECCEDDFELCDSMFIVSLVDNDECCEDDEGDNDECDGGESINVSSCCEDGEEDALYFDLLFFGGMGSAAIC